MRVSGFWTILHDNFWPFLKAAWITVQLTGVSLFIATFIGLFVAFMKISPIRVLRLVADGYIGLVRGLPLIVQLMFLYYGIAGLVVLPSFWAGSLALAIHSGAYVAEIFRGAIQSIDKGQYEAARSLGMPYRLAMRRVILPQAARRAIPPLGNQFIIGLKDSSLVAFLGVMELFGTAMQVQANTFRALASFSAVGLYYLVMVIIITLILKRVEQRLAVTTRTNGSSAKKALRERLRSAET